MAEKTIAGIWRSNRALEHARDLLADDRAHRAAHELEREEAQRRLDAIDTADAAHECILATALLHRGRDSLDIWLRVREAQRISGTQLGVVLDPRVRIGRRGDALIGRHHVVMGADGAYA